MLNWQKNPLLVFPSLNSFRLKAHVILILVVDGLKIFLPCNLNFPSFLRNQLVDHFLFRASEELRTFGVLNRKVLSVVTFNDGPIALRNELLSPFEDSPGGVS